MVCAAGLLAIPTACKAPPPKVHRPSSRPATRTEGEVQLRRAARGEPPPPRAADLGVVLGRLLWDPPCAADCDLRKGSCERIERAPAEMRFLRKVRVEGSGAAAPLNAILRAGE